MNKMFRFVRQARVAIGAGALVVGAQAHAALPTEVTAAIDGAGDDLLAAIGAVIVAMVAFWGLNKVASKMGWK